MILIRICKLVSLYFLLSGCAYIHSLDDKLPNQMDAWIKNGEYGKALDTLYYIQPDNKNYKTLMLQKEKIIRLAEKFEQDILEKGGQYVREGSWHEADETYKHGLAKLPDSRAIQKAYAGFIDKRAVYLKQLKLKLLQNKTKWLLSDTEIRREIARVIPKNHSARWLVQDHEMDIDSTSKMLIECANESIINSELDVARQCLNIARQLDPSAYFQERIIEVSTKLEQEIQVRARNLSKQGQKTLRNASMSLARGDFRTAHQMLGTLPEHDKKNGMILKFKDELDEQTEDYVDKTILEGRRLYSAGKVQEAYLLWKSLKPLAPDNERLQGMIDRAEKILRKLHKIGSAQDVVVPPVKK